MRRRGILLVVLILAAISIPNPAMGTEDQQIAEPQLPHMGTFVIAGDAEPVPVESGDIVDDVASSTPDGCQVVPQLRIANWYPDEVGQVSVSSHFDESCNLVVASIDPVDADDIEPGTYSYNLVHPLPVAHPHLGIAKFTILEQFGITSTEVEAWGTYNQDHDSIWGMEAFPVFTRCYDSAFPFWTRPKCFTETYSNDDVGNWIRQTGEFHHIPFGLDWEIWADYRQFIPPTGWVYYCGFNHGTIPPLWRTDCFGVRADNPSQP